MISFIGCNRLSLIGDCICSLPFSTYLEKLYPGSLKIGLVDKKCEQISPLLINAPNLDGIYITEESDKITQKDEDYFKRFSAIFEPYPQPTEEHWYNKMDVREQTFKMTWLRGQGRINPEEWNTLTEEEKKPRLNQWFKTEKQGEFVTIWASAGYGNNDLANIKRNPSKEYWTRLVDRLLKEGYEVVQLGLPSPNIHPDILNLSNLSLFEAIKFTLRSSICNLQTDSGSSHLLGAYGVNQIVLSTYWRKGHITNPFSLYPANCKNQSINLFCESDINLIEYDKIVEGIKLLNE